VPTCQHDSRPPCTSHAKPPPPATPVPLPPARLPARAMRVRCLPWVERFVVSRKVRLSERFGAVVVERIVVCHRGERVWFSRRFDSHVGWALRH